MGAPAAKDHPPNAILKAPASRLTIRVPVVDGDLLAVARGELEPIEANDSGFPGPRDDDDPLCIRIADPADPFWLDGLIPRKARPL